MRRKLARSLVICLFLSIAGCGGDSVGRTVPVKGKVSVGTKALNGGTLVFWPDEAKGNKSKHEAGGTIGADGAYELFTKGKPGAAPGAYKVTLAANTGEIDSTKPTVPKSPIPEAYTTKDKTPLTVEVVETPGAGAYDLIVK